MSAAPLPCFGQPFDELRSAEDIGGGGALIVRGRGACAAPCPAPRDLVLLPDAGFVGEPDFYCGRIDVLLARDRVQTGGKVYGMARPSLRRCKFVGGISIR